MPSGPGEDLQIGIEFQMEEIKAVMKQLF